MKLLPRQLALLALGLLALTGCADECTSGACGCESDPSCLALCSDHRQDGDETGTDCGGSCAPCADTLACTSGTDCSSGSCVDGACSSEPSGAAGGSGGEGPGHGGSAGEPPSEVCTSACPAGSTCAQGDTCASGACNGGLCSDGNPTGDAGVTDPPPDGPPPCNVACAVGYACTGPEGCTSGICSGGLCVAAATCGDSVFNGTETATDCGGGACAGCGQGLACELDRDCASFHCIGSSCVVGPTFTPVLLSTTDHSPSPLLALSPDRLGLEVIEADYAGARSERSIVPGSGMFYFEGERTTNAIFDEYFGVATAAVPLEQPAGASNQSFGADSSGAITYNGLSAGDFERDGTFFYGFVVDYRGSNPIVHVIANSENANSIRSSTALTGVTGALYILVGGRRRKVGEQARINPGNDTTNFPFHYDPVAALNAGGFDGDALVRGWGQTHAAPADTAPNLNVSTNPPSATILLGAAVTLNATATDVEDGQLSGSIQWADLATTYAERDTHVGASWTLIPRAIGIHPIEVSVRDSAGRVTSAVVDVTVTGTLPQFNPVQLVPDDRAGVGVNLRGDALAAHWTSDGKYGIRANQGMIREFQYFEIHRLREPANQGGGVVIKEGDLAPYNPVNVPPSCSVNEFQSIWQDLISVQDYDVVNTEYYGFAVDYRNRHPIVYVITHDGTSNSDVLAHTMLLDDVTVPLYPMIYGNPQAAGPPFDAEINFGATSFHYNPAAVLNAAGVNPSGLQVGWGDANTP